MSDSVVYSFRFSRKKHRDIIELLESFDRLERKEKVVAVFRAFLILQTQEVTVKNEPDREIESETAQQEDLDSLEAMMGGDE